MIDRKKLEEIVGQDCKGKLAVKTKETKYRKYMECRYDGNCAYKIHYHGKSICKYEDK